MTNGPPRGLRTNVWIYTWNNPNVDPDQHHASFESIGCSFHVFQRERGENGTEHFQGYVELRGSRGLNSLKACNTQIHWEPRRGTQIQAIEYSSKEDTRIEGPWRFGEPKRTTQTGCNPDFQLAVKEGKRLRELHEAYPDEMRKYPRYQESLREVYPPPVRETAPEVILLLGAPGTGKTRYVRSQETADDLYIKPCDRDFWMNGFDLHPAVLIDDFMGASNHITLTNLLQLLDRYQIRVSTKHGHTWWQPDRIYITTNIHPANWYEYKTRMIHYAALVRRFTRVLEFGGMGDVEYVPTTRTHGVEWDMFWDFETHWIEKPSLPE